MVVDKVDISKSKENLPTKKKDKKPVEVVSFTSLFRYATSIDIIFMLIGTTGGVIQGFLFPLLVLIFGELLNTLTNRSTDLCKLNFTSLAIEYCPPDYHLTSSNFFTSSSICHLNLTNATRFDFQGSVKTYVNYLVILGCVGIISSYIQVVFWSITAERQTRVIRQNLFRSILRKDISYFDTHKAGELQTKLSDDIQRIHNGIGDKIGSTSRFISSFFIRIILGFIKGWKLTLVIISVSPLLFIAFVLFAKVASSLTTMELKAYEKAGAIAQEVFSSIRTVFSYNGQERETKRYDKHLDEAKRNGIKKGAITGFTLGIMWFLVYCTYALGFWYGAKLIRDEGYSIGDVSVVFFSIILAVFNLAQVAPHFQAVIQARAAASIVWKVIDASSKINNHPDEGLKEDDFISDIHFSNVHFSYPSQSDVKILNGISFDIKHGQTIALVGSSGSGKSTCIQLLQRFYDPNSGSILIDKHKLTEYNVKWLREHIGVVSQEPILFEATIRENILLGKDSATDEEIYQAAKMANAHDFIMNFPHKYDTRAGECGAALSGGQKQRIAIARALIRNPKILLLDEATSALDNKSEKIVQEALDRAREGRTTIIVAHRLSTIRNVDKIVVIDKGVVVEEGNHHSLMDAQGMYFGLVQQQNIPEIEEDKQLSFKQQENIEEIQIDSIEDPNIIDLTSIDEKKKTSITLNMLLMNKPEWIFIIFGCLSCICNGGIQPAFGIILSKLTAVFQECDEQIQKEQVLLYIIVFIGFAVLIFITIFCQNFLFACSGEALTKRLRSKSFRAILCQEISYFDNPKNTIGALCTRLGSEASVVQGATGIYIGIIFQNFASLGTSIIISFIFAWQLTLLSLIFVPFLVIRGFLENYLLRGFATKDKQIFEDVGKITVECIQNIRTVVQLTREDYFYEKYCLLLEKPYRSAIKRAQLLALFFALTCSIIYFSLAALFRLGTSLLEHNTVTLEDILLCFNCLILGAQNVGESASLSPDYIKGVRAAEKIFELLNRKPTINNHSSDGDEIPDFNGELEFDNIHFIYPNRPEAIILKNLKLKIQAGERIALVGASGCGKSTTIQLIERFYDVNAGQLLVNSKDIRNLNLQWYRSQIGIVSQQPVLFDMSIKENIAYGDNNRNDIPMEEIIEAAKKANIHDFIAQLPTGYETNCGAKGSQLSGGQKQRIAIARALIRNPKILLLDEATSALDSESEKIVQEALDHAQINRTSITIAHRLSTIQNADMIYVLHNGMIIESGTHQELIDLGGHYYQLAVSKHK